MLDRAERDARVARRGLLGGELRAPSTLGTFLRAFTWGHALQLDAASRRLLARAWEAGAGPGAARRAGADQPGSDRRALSAVHL